MNDVLSASGIECKPSHALELKDVVDGRNMLRLLMSVHPLAVETGRHDGRPLHERTVVGILMRWRTSGIFCSSASAM